MQSDLFALQALVEDDHWWFAGRRGIMRALLLELLPVRERALVVDIGCGTGGNIASLADTYECIGIDVSPDAIALARERHPRVRYIHGQAPDHLGADAARARAFLLMDVLEHVRDDRALLASVVSAATPGAYVLVTVPADMSLWSPHDERFGHYRRYAAERLSAVWDHLPVEVELLSYFNARLYPIIRMARAVSRRVGRSFGLGRSDLWSVGWPLNRLLMEVFEREGRALVRALHGASAAPYRRGVSLVAVLRRVSGEMVQQEQGVPAVRTAMAAGQATTAR